MKLLVNIVCIVIIGWPLAAQERIFEPDPENPSQRFAKLKDGVFSIGSGDYRVIESVTHESGTEYFLLEFLFPPLEDGEPQKTYKELVSAGEIDPASLSQKPQEFWVVCIHQGKLVSGADRYQEIEVWNRHTIDPTDPSLGKRGADGVRLADVNGDGLLDIVTGWENGGAIRVCLNPGADKVKQAWPAVTIGQAKGVEDALFADLDGDGQVDVISACEGSTQSLFVHWAPATNEYLDSGKWQTDQFSFPEAKQQWMYLNTLDIDRDGDLDIIAGSKRSNGSIGWLANPGKEKARDLELWQWTKMALIGWTMDIRITDLDADSELEIIYSDRREDQSGIYVMRHLKQAPWLSKPKSLGFKGKEVMFIDLCDLNGDNKLDIAAAIQPQEIGYLYQPTTDPLNQPWQSQFNNPVSNHQSERKNKAVLVTDIDQDGKLDVIVSSENATNTFGGVFHFPFTTDMQTPCVAKRISGPEGTKFDRLELLDLDNDGDLDLITCEEREGLGVFWYENPLN